MSIWNKKIPTGVALVLIVLAVVATTFLVQTGVISFIGAAPSSNPQDVRITNISDSSVSITFKTDAKVIGTVSIGKDKSSLQTILDERDQQSGTPQQYNVHSITIKNLQPNTSYVFSITSGTTTYLNHDSYFTTQTAPPLNTPPSAQDPLTGKLVTPDGTNPTEALVYVTTDNGQILSTLTKPTGVYTIPMNTFRTADLKGLFPFQNNTTLHILATDGTDSSQATVLISGSNPVPLITLSQTYNFISSPQPVASNSAEASIGFPAFATTKALEATPMITTPQKDEGFTDAQPEFSGRGVPNQTVTIEIHSSQAITATVQTDANGNWTYRPTQQLSPGNHTLTIMTKDANGVLQTIQQSFTVFAAGTQLNQSPSISPTQPATTPTTGPTTKPSPTSKPTVTTTVTPTQQPTLQPTTVPTASITTKLTPKPTLPATGSNSLVVAGTTGIITTVIGIILFLISRGAVL